jgi:hypothetical protein
MKIRQASHAACGMAGAMSIEPDEVYFIYTTLFISDFDRS